ncbi:MAG TPA: hypothetical protein VMT71_08395 [Syntrophorhabdales bacterium]|nr:hypothetical protein [Syntrophorhabdales bacterium]
MQARNPDQQLEFAKIPAVWLAISALAVVVGVITFVVALSGNAAQRAWQVYLVNYLFWVSLSLGSVLFVAVLNLSKAMWARPFKRLAESLGAFLPVAFVLFWVVYAGRSRIFYWVLNPHPKRLVWLSTPFVFSRDGFALLAMILLALALMYYSVRSDRQWLKDPSDGAKWQGSWRAQIILSPIYAIVYCYGLSLIGFDLIMSLDPDWYSTLFGAYFFTASFYIALAAIALLLYLSLARFGIGRFIRERQLHDMGKMMLGFCLFTGYLFYAQFLTIWYGNLPDEVKFVIMRVKLGPYNTLAWIILGAIFLLPFFTLLSRRIKVHPVPMAVLSIIILIGMWLERFILVVPSTWKTASVPLGFVEVLVTIGFAGLVALCLALYLRMVPLFPVSDPLFARFKEEGETELEP